MAFWCKQEHSISSDGGWQYGSIHLRAVSLFLKSNYPFLGYFPPVNIMYMTKVDKFRSDLTNISTALQSLPAELRAIAVVGSRKLTKGKHINFVPSNYQSYAMLYYTV